MPIEPRPRTTRKVEARSLWLPCLTMGLAIGLFVVTIGAPSGPSEPIPELRIDPNTAPAGVLEALPKGGPAVVSRIIEARDQAPFRDLDDFDVRVRGVGPVMLEAMRPYLRFDSTTDR